MRSAVPKTLILLLAALWCAAYPVCVHAEVVDVPAAEAPQVAEEEPLPAEQFLPISEDAKEEARKVEGLIERGEWREAVAICQQMIDNPPKGVVPLGEGIYGSARVLFERKVAQLPPPAMLLYRTLHDPEAERLHQRVLDGRDLDAARELVTRFAFTSRGQAGRRLLAELLFERGEASGALRLWLDWMDAADLDATPELERRTVAVKVALAAALSNDAIAFDRALRLFGEKGAVVEAGGRKISRAGELETFIDAMRPQASGSVSSAPPVLDLERWSGRWMEEDEEEDEDHYYYGYGYVRNSLYQCEALLAGGVYYVNTPNGARAYETLTGRLIWQRPRANYDADYRSVRPFAFFCRLYEAPDASAPNQLYVSGGNHLTAYNATDGTELWTIRVGAFKGVNDIVFNEDEHLAFNSPAVCRGSRAYVMAELSSGGIYVIAIDRATGKTVWVTAVGADYSDSGYRVACPASLALAGPDVVFYTGSGIMGNCDADTGEIRWLRPHKQSEVVEELHQYTVRRGVPYRPIVLVGESALIAPSDGVELFCIDTATGAAQWREELDEGTRFLGVFPEGAGRKESRAVLISEGDVRCISADTGAVVWVWPVPGSSRFAQGAVAGGRVELVAPNGVYTLDGDSGELLQFLPLNLGGGRELTVAASADALAVTSYDAVRVIAGVARTREMVQEVPSEAAQTPWVVAMDARVLRAEGKLPEAMSRLTEAVGLARGRNGAIELAKELEKERVDLSHELAQSAWNQGRRVEAFAWIMQALQSPGGGYECRFGYRVDVADEDAPRARLQLASGDVLTGRLGGVEGAVATLFVDAEPWRIATAGIDHVRLAPARDTQGETSRGQYVVLANGDRISGRVESVRDGVLRLRAGFGVLEFELSTVAAVGFDGVAPEPAKGMIYVKLSNGDELSGRVAAFDGEGLVLDMPACGRHRIPLGQVYSLASRRGMPPGEKARERFHMPQTDQ